MVLTVDAAEPIPHTLGGYACLDFVNSRLTDHVGGGAVIDRIELPQWRTWFLDRWHLSPVVGSPPLASLKSARQTMRRLLEDWAAKRPLRIAETRRLDRWMSAAPMRRRYGAGMEPVRRDWVWVLAEVAASLERLLAENDPSRLKICANPGCTWMFLDESRNLSRRWCDPETCGNLITVREFRRRQRDAARER